jgi:hypothetical protein
MAKPVVTITRTESSDEGTFGVLTFQGSVFSYKTGELPWRNNAPGISCIPAGTYECATCFSWRFMKTLYEVRGVENRSNILIHSANWMGDESKGLKCQLNGCIALGKRIGEIAPYKQKALLSSNVAVEQFMLELKGQGFTLNIINAFPVVS